MFITVECKTAIISFGLALLLNLLILLALIAEVFEDTVDFLLVTSALNLIAVVLCQIVFKLKRDVSIRASLLGVACGAGLLLSGSNLQSWHCFGIYVMLFTFFHWSEYVSVAFISPRSLKIDSFLLNHSVEYWVAATASCLEYLIELWLWPTMKYFGIISSIGLLICLIGESECLT